MFIKILKFLLALAATLAVVWVGEKSLAVEDKNLPPLGKFISPFNGFWRNAEPHLKVAGMQFSFHPSQFSGEFEMLGLSEAVEVVFDEWRIPHIFAQNMPDAARVQGFLMARDRLWQMDILSRSASGRLSEVMGKRTFEIDRLTRRQGMVLAAQKNLESWEKDPTSKQLLDAFTTGVNFYIENLQPADFPLEFKLLNYAPELWSNFKTASVIENMTRSLTLNDNDLNYSGALALFGSTLFDEFYPLSHPANHPIVQDFGQWKGKNTASESASDAGMAPSTSFHFKKKYFGENTPPTQEVINGSNNWAIAAKKTANGKAILANDPHLNLSLPSIWYAVQLHTPEVNSLGVSLPGVPGIVIGFNENFAWGFTNASQDVVDWYKIRWKNAERTRYELDGQEKNARLQLEIIPIKGMPDVLDTVRYTEWGPVTYDFDADHPFADCSMHWVSHRAPDPRMFMTFLELATAQNVQQAQQGIQYFDAPGQNMAMADRSGNIGILVQGYFPQRKNTNGRHVQDGSRSELAWQGFVPTALLPRWINPSRGFVFSANQLPVPQSYPYQILGDFDDSRNRRIFNRLDKMQAATIDSMKSIQLDNFSSIAADVLAQFIALTDTAALNLAEKQIFQKMKNWNAVFDKSLEEPSIFTAWQDSAYRMTWDEIGDKKFIKFPKLLRWCDLMQKSPQHIIFDLQNTPTRESARDIVTQAFQKAVTPFLLPDPLSPKNWGKFKKFRINHLAHIEAFSRLDLETDGDRSSPNAIAPTHGPSWRMIVELADTVRAQAIYPGGQSGNPGSLFYDNMVETWARGEYLDMKLLRSPNEINIPNQKTTFKPALKK